MIEPGLLGGTPFRNPTALADLAGTVYLVHMALAQSIAQTTGRAVRLLPLGNGRGEPEWLAALTEQHTGEAHALGIATGPDFSEYDLNDPAAFASFTWVLGQDLTRLKRAAGIV